MTAENEEFEFRLRLERESGAAPQPAPATAPKSFNIWKPEFLSMDKYGNEAGGKVTDLAASAGTSPEVAAGLGTAANIGVQTVTPAGIGAVAGKLTGPLMEKAARGLVQSAIKPNLAVRQSGRAEQAITTMLEKDIRATPGAIEATQKRVDDIEASIQSVLENSPGIANKEKVAAAISTAMQDVRLNNRVIENLADVDKALQRFLNHPELVKYGNDIPVAFANRMKQAFTKEIKDKAYLPGQALSAEDKGIKALAGGLQREVAVGEPLVVPSLKEQSELINVLKVAGPQVSREGNKSLVGLGWLSPSMVQTIGWMLDRYPWFKSFAAHQLHTSPELLPGVVAAAATTATQQSGKQP